MNPRTREAAEEAPMNIEFTCPCGQRLRAKSEDVGRRMRCPACDQEMIVPNSPAPAPAAEFAPQPVREERTPRRREREERDDWDDEPRRRETPTRTSGKAIGALIFGVLSFCLSLLAGIPAVILGVLSLSDIAGSRGRIGGRGLAITGIVLGVVGSLMIGPAILLALLLPAVQKVREASVRVQSSNNLHQIGLAMHNYHDTYGVFPPSVVFDKDGKPLYSWRVLILPFIEADLLYKQFHLDEPWDSPNNKPLLARMPRTFMDPADVTPESGMTHYQVFDGPGAPFDSSARPLVSFSLAGVNGPPGQLQMSNRRLTIAGITDGLANTLLVVEAPEGVPWSKPQDLPFGPGKPLPQLSRPARRGFLALYADASVRTIPDSTSEQTLRALITPNGGEPLGPDAP
jgi:hypothetical protein